MDATGNLESEPPPAPGEVLRRTEELRHEIEATSRLLHEHIAELGDHLRGNIEHRVEALSNPFGLRDRFEQHPLSSCALALALGVSVARLSQRRSGFASAREGFAGAIKRALVARVVEGVVRSIGPGSGAYR